MKRPIGWLVVPAIAIVGKGIHLLMIASNHNPMLVLWLGVIGACVWFLRS